MGTSCFVMQRRRVRVKMGWTHACGRGKTSRNVIMEWTHSHVILCNEDGKDKEEGDKWMITFTHHDRPRSERREGGGRRRGGGGSRTQIMWTGIGWRRKGEEETDVRIM